MRITRRQLRYIIKETVCAKSLKLTEITDDDMSDDELLALWGREAPDSSEDQSISKQLQPGDPGYVHEVPASGLPGGKIDSFKTEPVASGRYNIGSDSQTLKSKSKGGGLEDDDPDIVSPGMGHSKKLFVVDPAPRDKRQLEPRAAWQNREFHKGQDIFGVIGDDIPAYIDGYVHKAERESGDGGNVVTIATAEPVSIDKSGKKIYPTDTEFIRYAHLDSIGATDGTLVRAGEIIGTLGCTGNCGSKKTAPHIHLSVSGVDSKGMFSWSSDTHRDPYDLFDKSGWITDRGDLKISESSTLITRRHIRSLVKEAISQQDVEDVHQTAQLVHLGQKRRDATEYIAHPLAVYELTKRYYPRDSPAHLLALLHDTLEDAESVGNVTQEEAYEMIQASIHDRSALAMINNALQLMTHDKSIPYDDYLQSALHDKIAGKVKISDIIHNLSTSPRSGQIMKYKNAMESADIPSHIDRAQLAHLYSMLAVRNN